MKYIKFFFFQFILISCLFYINFYTDKYISNPFSREDLIGIVLGILQIPFFLLIFKVFTRFNFISKTVRVFLSLLSGLFSALIIGMLLGQVLPDLFH